MNNVNTPVLETKRLILRKFTKKDLKALFTIYSDKEVNRFLPWMALKSMDEAEIFFQQHYQKAYDMERAYKYAVCLKEDDIPIGYVHLSTECSHDLGYGLSKEFWHKGIITEACKAVVNRAKIDKITYITATHDVKNPRSGRVMVRLGMRYKYSYEELWQPKNILVTFRMYQINLDGEKERVYKKYWNDSIVHFVETGI